MDALSYAHSAKQAKRIKKFIADPDSNSGLLTQPKVIDEVVTVPNGRVVAIVGDLDISPTGELNIEADGDVFIPSGSSSASIDSRINDLIRRIEILEGGN